MKNKITLLSVAFVFFGSSDVICSNDSGEDDGLHGFPALVRSTPRVPLRSSKPEIAGWRPELEKALCVGDVEGALYWMRMGRIPDRSDLVALTAKMEENSPRFAKAIGLKLGKPHDELAAKAALEQHKLDVSGSSSSSSCSENKPEDKPIARRVVHSRFAQRSVNTHRESTSSVQQVSTRQGGVLTQNYFRTFRSVVRSEEYEEQYVEQYVEESKVMDRLD